MKPSTSTQQLHQAISWHQQGDLRSALSMYQQVLSVDPENFTALHCLGILFGQLGRFEDALVAFTKASIVHPNDFAAHYNRGKALQELKRYDEALDAYNKTLKLNNNYADAYNNRGIVLQQLRRFEEAVASFNNAIALRPDFADACNNRGNVLTQLQRYEDALASFDKGILLNPNYASAYNSRGLIQLDVFKRIDAAVSDFRHALTIEPNYAEAHFNLGNALKDLLRYQDALMSYDKAIALNPNFADAYYGRGVLLSELKQCDEALESFNRALTINPELTRARYNIGIIKLLQGNFEEGWPLYELRWTTDQVKGSFQDVKQPLWLGESPIRQKTLLIHAEQGLGDVIQLVRYLPLLESQGAKLLLAVPPSLVTVIQTLKGSFSVITKTDNLPEFDLHCPIMSLPLALHTTLETIPQNVPYLAVSPTTQAKWRERLGPRSKPRVGLVWSGNQNHKNDHNRSIPLQLLKPLLDLDFEFHSLQIEIRPSDQPVFAESAIFTHAQELHDFSDTAALISELDMVIAVDTSVAHLTGALGKPLWIMLPYVPDFRWLLDRDDSPWYPTARLFRQSILGNWDTVIEAVYSSLQSRRENM